jgi:hypothetical protein
MAPREGSIHTHNEHKKDVVAVHLIDARVVLRVRVKARSNGLDSKMMVWFTKEDRGPGGAVLSARPRKEHSQGGT